MQPIIKTASDLKAYVQDTGSHFFDRSSMKFFGDTMANYGVRTTTIKSHWNEFGLYVAEGIDVEVYELYRRNAVKHGLKDSAYFDKVSFKRVHPVKG